VTGTGTGDDQLDVVGELLTARAGYRLDPVVRDRLLRTVADAAKGRKQSLDDYVADLRTDAGALQSLLDSITVQETWFFREPAHFAALVDDVLPGQPGPITIWSAGCANGQEAWSIAMALHEAGRSDCRVLATDVSARALARAVAGQYSDRELRGLSDGRRARFLTVDKGGARINTMLRERVRFIHHNLVTDPVPLPARLCPVVFCRNVMIYLDPEARLTALNRMAGLIPHGGWLFLGFSESLWQITDAFEPVRVGNAFAYRRAGPRRDPERQRPPATKKKPPRRPAVPPPAAVAAAPVTEEPAVDDITSARRAVYECPDDPIAHLHLGLRLEASGDRIAAGRAFAASRAALDRCDPAHIEAALEGWQPSQLAGLLDARLAATSSPRR
jgi:chemotaxis protein methyltransferase CheR